MVSGGPYGIEDILGGAGFLWAIAILLVLPIIWSLPSALMIGELASAIPAEGGFYIWVRRALGPFWGYQESWLSLSASVFDMAIYPGHLLACIWASFSPGADGREVGMAMPTVAGGRHSPAASGTCAALPAVGGRSSRPISADALAVRGLRGAGKLAGRWTHHPAVQWNPRRFARRYSSIHRADGGDVELHEAGDNASTVGEEVENPQRTYPRAMIASALLVAFTYIVPLLAMACAGLSAENFSTGGWVDLGRNSVVAGRLARRCCGGRRRHQRLRDVQRAGDELCPALPRWRWRKTACCRAS